MSIKIERVTLIKSSYTEEGLLPDTLGIKEEDVNNWVTGKECEIFEGEYEIVPHPFPEDPEYSMQDLIGDLTSSGSWTLPDKIKQETCNWLVDFLEAHI